MNNVKLKKFILFYCGICIMVLTGCGKPSIGIRSGKLMPCPSSPNCVSSQTTDSSHYTEPLTYTGTRDYAQKVILSILSGMDGSDVVEVKSDYIHVEFTSKIFGFVDDVEFYFSEDASLIQVRSASRTGYSDFGVNKDRIIEIRKLFNEKMEVK